MRRNRSNRKGGSAGTAVFFAAALPLSSLAACGDQMVTPPPGQQGVCTEEARAGLNVVVLAENGGRICNAQVTAVENDYSEDLQLFGAGADCSYAGAFERAGEYLVKATAPGYVTGAVDAVVSQDECHVIPVNVEITLETVSSG